MNRLHILSLLAAVIFSGGAGAVTLHLDSDRITLRVQREPLIRVLERFADAGVFVQVDPSIDVLVTGSCAMAPVEEALAALLQPFAYVAIWDVVSGPLGDLPRLAELHVYQSGARERMRPLETGGALRIARGPFPDSPEFVADELLIRVAPGANPDAVRAWFRSIGATLAGSVPSLGIYQLRVPPGVNLLDLIDQARRHPLLADVEPNYVTRLPDLRPTDAAGPIPSQPQAPSTGFRGAAPLAILDSGVSTDFGLDSWVAGRFNALAPDRDASDPVGHGTQMALVAAGLIRPAGAAPSDEGLPVLAIRAFDDRGATSDFALIRAIDYAARQGARVLNLSWGTPTHSPFLADAIAYAQAKGLVVVAAAGNEPTGRPVYPAAYPGVVAVSAVTPKGDLWDRSNRGDFVTVAAPGAAVLPVGYQGPPGTYAGTSIASAAVARELALYFARHPNASARDAIAALQQAVTDAGPPGRDPLYGHGVLDPAAQARLRTATGLTK